MKRAVVIYLDNNRSMMYQMGCLYWSWKHIKAADTDLVVFGTQHALDRVPDDCIKVLYKPISHEPEWNNYYFISSISCIAGSEADFLDRYDFVLRSDADTFLTPSWNRFYPTGYVTGCGKYVNDENTKQNIIRCAKAFGLRHFGIHNIGSTHYGPARLVREVCKLTVPITKYFIGEEFKYDPGKWPGWAAEVSILYASEIAVNHLVQKPRVDGKRLDYDSTSSDITHYHPHIHCWHTSECFSKFGFFNGEYDNIDINLLNKHKVKDYCMYIALSSKKAMPEFFL
jgi:hypothetical protein